MEPPPEHRRSWWITVRTRFRGLEFRLAAFDVLPDRGIGGESISSSLRLRRLFLLEVEAHNRVAAGAGVKKQPLWKKILRLRRWLASRKLEFLKNGKKPLEAFEAVNLLQNGGRQHQPLREKIIWPRRWFARRTIELREKEKKSLKVPGVLNLLGNGVFQHRYRAILGGFIVPRLRRLAADGSKAAIFGILIFFVRFGFKKYQGGNFFI